MKDVKINGMRGEFTVIEPDFREFDRRVLRLVVYANQTPKKIVWVGELPAAQEHAERRLKDFARRETRNV